MSERYCASKQTEFGVPHDEYNRWLFDNLGSNGYYERYTKILRPSNILGEFDVVYENSKMTVTADRNIYDFSCYHLDGEQHRISMARDKVIDHEYVRKWNEYMGLLLPYIHLKRSRPYNINRDFGPGWERFCTISYDGQYHCSQIVFFDNAVDGCAFKLIFSGE
jgi:hypothetical protein